MVNRRQFLGSLCLATAGTSVLQGANGLPVSREEKITDDPARIAALFKKKEPVKWLFTGDSITQGAKHTHGMRSYPEIFAERVRWELGRMGDVVINTAVSGNTSADIIRDLERRIFQYQPQAVFVMLGTNDAALQKGISVEMFEQNIRTIATQVRNNNAIPVLLSPNRIVESQAKERAWLKDYVAVLKAIAVSGPVIYADVWNAWDTELEQKYGGQQYRRLLNDPLHPNGYGHQEIAMLLFKTLSVYDAKEPSCGGAYYENKNW